jgi:sulfatase modifying factor 1
MSRAASVVLAVPWIAACGAAPATSAHAPSMATAAPPPRPVAPATSATPAVASLPVVRPRCPEGMVDLGAFCVDRYEAPNVEGARPFVLKTADDGEAWCAERGKRLCTENEWVRACQGPHGRTYPYGDEYRPSTCNDERKWIPVHWELLAKWPAAEAVDEAGRLFQGEASGVRAGCVSAEGVRDLTGNVAEWVRRSDAVPRPGYDHVLKGCYWAGCYHEPHPNCVFRNSAHPGSFRTYEAGFRCCADGP